LEDDFSIEAMDFFVESRGEYGIKKPDVSYYAGTAHNPNF
jgi:hypothetical protein